MALARLLRSTVFQLICGAVLLLGLAAAVAVTFIGWRANAALTGMTQASIEADSAELRRVLSFGGFDALVAAVDMRDRLARGVYFLSDLNGRRRSGNLGDPPSIAAGEGGAGVFRYVPLASQGGTARTAAGVAVRLEGGGVLVVARDIEDQRMFLAAMLRDLALGLGGLALLGIAGGLLLARHILRRIEVMAQASEAIMAGNLAGRIPRTGSDDELDRLADHLNDMIARIERLMAGLREVSDNIAHDLKTPLNRLRNRAEAALNDHREAAAWREALERTIEEADELIKTFNALLLIARLEAGALDDSLETLDLAEVARDVADLYGPAAEDAGFRIRIDAGVGAPIKAHRQLIGQAVANLVDNAIKYSAAATTADAQDPAITITVTRAGNRAALAVADRGPGIALDDRERALRRFVRLDASRTLPGTGLGLSLVAAVAHVHRGTIALEDNAPGLSVVLAFPLAEPVSRPHPSAPACSREKGIAA